MRLKSKIFAFVLILVSLSTGLLSGSGAAAAAPAGGRVGAGLVLGEPTALTGKIFVREDRAIDAGVAFALDRWVLVYGDWLLHYPDALGKHLRELGGISPYIGIGMMAAISNKTDAETRKEKYYSENSSSKLAVGVRLPLGIEWRTSTLPLGFFAELVPGMTVVPSTSGFVQGGVGLRFYF